jgi:hypothetical protein
VYNRLISSGWQVAGSRQHRKEPSGFTKGREFHVYMGALQRISSTDLLCGVTHWQARGTNTISRGGPTMVHGPWGAAIATSYWSQLGQRKRKVLPGRPSCCATHSTQKCLEWLLSHDRARTVAKNARASKKRRSVLRQRTEPRDHSVDSTSVIR